MNTTETFNPFQTFRVLDFGAYIFSDEIESNVADLWANEELTNGSYWCYSPEWEEDISEDNGTPVRYPSLHAYLKSNSTYEGESFLLLNYW